VKYVRQRAGNVARAWETREAYRIFVKKVLGKRPIGRQRRKRKMTFRSILVY
jgi:hypothetical protein